MPELEVQKGYFESHADVMKDLETTGYWPTTYISGETPELPIHHHDHDIIGYVMEGETYLLNAQGERVPVEAGDRLVIPKGAEHAEGEVKDRVVYIVSFREPVQFMDGIMPKGMRTKDA